MWPGGISRRLLQVMIRTYSQKAGWTDIEFCDQIRPAGTWAGSKYRGRQAGKWPVCCTTYVPMGHHHRTPAHRGAAHSEPMRPYSPSTPEFGHRPIGHSRKDRRSPPTQIPRGGANPLCQDEDENSPQGPASRQITPAPPCSLVMLNSAVNTGSLAYLLKSDCIIE